MPDLERGHSKDSKASAPNENPEEDISEGNSVNNEGNGSSSDRENAAFAKNGTGDYLFDEESLLSGSEDPVENEEEDDGLPIDRGWAWVVLAGSFLNITMMVGYIRGTAILFVEYLAVFGASTTKTTLLMGVLSCVYSIAALLSMHILVDMIGERKTVMLGVTLSVLGMVTAIFATSIDFMIGTHAVLLGMGHAMIYGPSIVMVGKYFKKRRGFASSAAMSAMSLAGCVFPPLTRFLLDEYGLSGTMLILTGLTMNMWVGAAVFVPLEHFRKKNRKKCVDKNKKHADVNSEDTHIRLTQTFAQTEFRRSELDSPFVVRQRIRTESNCSSMTRPTKHAMLYASQPELGSISFIGIDADNDIDAHSLKSKRTCSFYCRRVVTSLDFRLLRKPMLVYILLYSFCCITLAIVQSYLPVLAEEKGISQQTAALFLSVLGGLDFFCKLLLGCVIDSGMFRVTRVMAIGVIVTGTLTNLTMFYDSFLLLLGYSVAMGIFSCTYSGMAPMATVELMGIDNMAKSLGFVSVMHGMSTAIAHPVVGLIRDATGSYTNSMIYVGVCCYIGAAILLCEPLLRSYLARKKYKPASLELEIKPINKT